METYNLNDIKSSNSIKDFLKQNSSEGFLKIRAYAANEAMPIKNLYIKVTKVIDDKTVVFYEGKTDDSGIIENVKLPAPRITLDDQTEPKSANYSITTMYMDKNYSKYVISVYENVLVIQNINIVPGDNNGY